MGKLWYNTPIYAAARIRVSWRTNPCTVNIVPAISTDLMGQRHVTQTLANAISSERVSHAYLFCGPRGTGKTSTARVLAKALNCVHGPTATPCDVCPYCCPFARVPRWT